MSQASGGVCQRQAGGGPQGPGGSLKIKSLQGLSLRILSLQLLITSHLVTCTDIEPVSNILITTVSRL